MLQIPGIEDIINQLMPQIQAAIYTMVLAMTGEMIGYIIKYLSRPEVLRAIIGAILVGILSLLGAFVVPIMASWGLPVAILVFAFFVLRSVNAEFAKDIQIRTTEVKREVNK